MNKYNEGQEIIMDGKHYFITRFRAIMGTYQYSLSETKGSEFCFACGEASIDGAVDEGENNHDDEPAKPDLSQMAPNFDQARYLEHGSSRWKNDFDPNEMMPLTIQRAQGLSKTSLIFARPCHSDFVNIGIRNMPSEMEALYITVPENLYRYNDLGVYECDAELLDHEGVSEDGEVVYSIKKGRM